MIRILPYYVYQVDAIESWLDEQAKKGLFLTDVRSRLTMDFKKGDPRPVRYRIDVKQNPGTNAHSPDAYAFDAEGWPIPARRAPLTYAVEALSRLLVTLERLGITNFTRRLLNCPTPT